MGRYSASILSANWLKLGEEITRVEDAGCDCIHIDVTDGHFVSNITMGVDIAAAVAKHTDLRKDVHLMIACPEMFVDAFAEAGADSITFHAEATLHPFAVIKQIEDKGKLVGVALDPGTPIEAIEHYLHKIDIVLIVAVCVGFGGQMYIEEMDEKVRRLKNMKAQKNLGFEIQIDGGITVENAKEKLSLGVDTIVAGSMFFNSKNVSKMVKKLRD